jgi:hypothetical protein
MCTKVSLRGKASELVELEPVTRRAIGASQGEGGREGGRKGGREGEEGPGDEEINNDEFR